MEGQTNPASWPWFQLMSDALEGRLTGKAPRVTPVWTNEEDGVFGSSPPPDRDCLMAERSSVSELESMVGGDNAESDGNVTYIDASGEECSTPSDPTYKSERISSWSRPGDDRCSQTSSRLRSRCLRKIFTFKKIQNGKNQMNTNKDNIRQEVKHLLRLNNKT